MAKQTFTWTPRIGATGTAAPKVTVVQFADGYEQRVQNGLNHDLRTYALTFNGLRSRVLAIEVFLTEHAARTSFYWQPPSRTKASLFVCETWTEVYLNGRVWELTAEFRGVIA